MKTTNFHSKSWARYARLLIVGLSCVTLAACGNAAKPGSGNTNGSGPSTANFGAIHAPHLTHSPYTIDFVAVNINSSQTKTLTISNSGQGTLKISSIKLVEGHEDNVKEMFKGPNWINAANLSPGQSAHISVIYKPLNRIQDTGYVEIKSNDPDHADLHIQIETPQLEPHIYTPGTVRFPRVPPGQTLWKTTDVFNNGQAPLQISSIVLSGGNQKFSVSYPDPTKQNPAPSTDSQTPPQVVQPGKSFPIRITFKPTTNNPVTANLDIVSNDPNKGTDTVQILGNSGSPCIQLSEESKIDFGESSIGQAANKTITVQNCSQSAKLHVSDIEMSNTGGGVFAIKQGSLPAGLPSNPAVINPGDTANFIITFTPSHEQVYNGELTVKSDDPAKGDLKVPVVGKGSNNTCPTAVAQGRISGGSTRYQTEIQTVPLKTLELDGSHSSDANGSVARYEWTVVQRPNGSTARLVPNNSVAQPRFFLDLAGTYVFQLTVYDNQGLASCQPSNVTVHTVPKDDIHLQLVWNTPSDPDQTDTVGTDEDLHFLNPLGHWNHAPYDIFWRNRTADWGQPGVTADNPHLDIDDTDGAGPENINLSEPQNGFNYSVGVYYYNDNGFGPSYATVRIYIHGQLAWQQLNKYMPQTGYFWYVAIIQWPSADIIKQNLLQQGFP